MKLYRNGQISSWLNVTAGVPQGSVFGPLLFLIYINDLPDEITSSCKIFADDTSLFSKIENKSYSNFQLNKDLETIIKWAFQWKMLFNPDPVKQAIEVCFSHKWDKVVYPPLQFNNNDVQSANSQKHLGLVLDSKLDFNEHVNNKINKCNKSIGIMKKLSLTLSRNSLLTIYKTFVRPILDYADLIYDKPLTESFKDKLEMVQYNSALVITGAFKGTSRDRIYRELVLESLAERRWSHKIFFFHKIINVLLPVYLQLYILQVYRTRSTNQKNLRQFSARTKIFESSFFLYCIKEWNNLSEKLRKIKSIVQLKTKILSFIRPKENSIFKTHDINGIKLLNHLRLHFSHLNEHKFRHYFRGTIDPMCICGLEPKTTLHYLLRCNLYSDLRAELLNDICTLNSTLKNLSHEKRLNILLYGSGNFSFNTDKKLIRDRTLSM